MQLRRAFFLSAVLIGTGVMPATAAHATTYPLPDTTVTRYEANVDPWALFQQGAADGKSGLAGAAILDFGRPAQDAAGTMSTLDFGGHLDALTAVVAAAESYIDGYRLNAAAHSAMTVLVGTNDSCGTGQPCGSTTCGCAHEPASFLAWGKAWGTAVGQIDSYVAATAGAHPVTVAVGGADDAEPGFDPGYTNTYDVLSGYADVTGRPMADYGSLDGGPGNSFWTAAQMYQVAYGFKPNVPFPEIYYPGMADQWAALSHWAAAHAAGRMTMYGVLTEAPTGYTPQDGYDSLLTALNGDYSDTGQGSVRWSSNVGATPALATPVGLTRLSGADRIATAVAVSRAAYPGAGSAKAAVLARSDTYPDALVGGPLAAAEGGPLLLSSPSNLDGAAGAELSRVLPKGSTVYLLGGTAALSPAVASAVTGAGYKVQRIAGADRYATAVAVARALGTPSSVLIASGTGFADALVAGTAAADTHGAVLLSAGSAPAAATTSYLKGLTSASVYAIGGPAASAYPSAHPIAGTDRYQTAAQVATRLVPGPSGAGLASGTDFPDGLVAAPLLARQGWPLLLSPPATVSAATLGYLSGTSGLGSLTVIGGTAALGDTVVFQARYVASS